MPCFVSGVVITLEAGTQTSSVSPMFPSFIGKNFYGASVSGSSGTVSATYCSLFSGRGSNIGSNTGSSCSFASSALGLGSDSYGSDSFSGSGNGSGSFGFSGSYPTIVPPS